MFPSLMKYKSLLQMIVFFVATVHVDDSFCVILRFSVSAQVAFRVLLQVDQLKRCHLTFLFVTIECVHKIQ